MPIPNPKGRPKASSIPDPILDVLKKLVEKYCHNTESIKEVDFQIPVKIISIRIWEFLRSSAASHEKKVVKNLVQSRSQSDEAFGNYLKEDYPQDLLTTRTLKHCYEEEGASNATIEILDAYSRILEFQEKAHHKFEQEIARISGLYYEFVTHNTSKDHLQESILQIKPDGKARTRYINTDFALTDEEFTTELIGTTGLLLTRHKSNDVLIFYIYIGADENPPFLQGVYLYSNKQGNTVANLAVFQRVFGKNPENEDEIYENFEPRRQYRELREDVYPSFKQRLKDGSGITLRENIQHYLLLRAQTLSTLRHEETKRPFDFSQSRAVAPGPLNQDARYYQTQLDLIGQFHLYFNEHYPAIREPNGKSPKDAFYSSIGEGILELSLNEYSGVIECTVRIAKRVNHNEAEEVMKYKGFVINHRMRNSSSLLLSLYLQPDDDRYLSFILNIVNRNMLMGCFNTAYTRPARFGAGVAIATRIIPPITSNKKTDKDNSATQPSSLLPFDCNLSHDANHLRPFIYNYLSVNQRGVVASPPYLDLKKYKDSLYKGRYYVYSSHPEKKDTLYRELLFINGNGAVRYLPLGINQIERGIAEQPNPNSLNITVKNNENQQVGFFCFRVDNVPPDEKVEKYKQGEKGVPVYCGSYCGFARAGDQGAIAAIVVLEFIDSTIPADLDKLETLPQTLSSDMAEWKDVPVKIRKKFSDPEKTTLDFPDNAYASNDL